MSSKYHKLLYTNAQSSKVSTHKLTNLADFPIWYTFDEFGQKTFFHFLKPIFLTATHISFSVITRHNICTVSLTPTHAVAHQKYTELLRHKTPATLQTNGHNLKVTMSSTLAHIAHISAR